MDDPDEDFSSSLQAFLPKLEHLEALELSCSNDVEPDDFLRQLQWAPGSCPQLKHLRIRCPYESTMSVVLDFLHTLNRFNALESLELRLKIVWDNDSSSGSPRPPLKPLKKLKAHFSDDINESVPNFSSSTRSSLSS